MMETVVLAIVNFIQGEQMQKLYKLFPEEDFWKAVDYLTNNQQDLYLWISVAIIILVFLSSVEGIIHNGIVNRKIAKIVDEKPRILNEGQTKKILVLGDSTAYGTGAFRVEDTLAGRFAHDFPDVEVNNYAVNGSLTKNAIEQIDRVNDRNYNLTIISTGGNDTWHFTNATEIEKNLRTLLTKAMAITGKNVVLIIYNNKDSAPVFPFFVRGRIIRRTKLFNEIFIRVANEYGIEAVPIFLPGEKCPRNFFSHDGLHPSSEGYRIMYIRLWATLYKHRNDYHLR